MAAVGEGEDGPRALLLLVCGLPGSGKSSFCAALLARLQAEPNALGEPPAQWRHLCFDEAEAGLRGADGAFDPAAWRAARELVKERVCGGLAELEAQGGRVVFLLDDNMYYRSMRRQWYHLAREQGCAYQQVLLAAPEQACLERNRSRQAAARVPDFSIQHMAEVFEWPEGGGTWEGPVSSVVDAAEAGTAEQVEAFLSRCGGAVLWTPLPPAEEPGPEPQSDAHACDVALRRVVARAMAQAPQELGPARSTLAKQWGSRKAALVKQLAKDTKAGAASPAELINEMESAFLRSCVADVQRQLQLASDDA